MEALSPRKAAPDRNDAMAKKLDLSDGPQRSAVAASTALPENPRAPVDPVGKEQLRGPEMAQLIEQAQHGDAAAFERLVSVYQGKIYGFARAFTADSAEAADLAQEALIKIYRSLGGFRYQSSLVTWMFRIVKNVFLDHHKSRRQRERRRELPLEATAEHDLHAHPGSGGGSPEAQLLADEERRALWAALSHIPEAYRTVVVLADMQGLSYEEIAGIVGAPVGTVKSRLNRGRDALREALEKTRQLS
jgi:RNA polymerase sigma-70 factor (ECF subfamily)